MKKRVLILCTGNACRSQMAEGLWRQLGGQAWEVCSAGLEPKGIHPLAVRAMRELELDISHHSSDPLERYLDQPFDLVVTVCSNAERNCPVFPNAARKEHWPFEDPADAAGADDERMPAFRRARDAIAERIQQFLDHGDTETRRGQ